MELLEPALETQAFRFRNLLQQMALFDEAHAVGVAVESPRLCGCDYVRTYLRQASTVAVMLGLFELSSWISDVLTSLG